MRVWTILAVAAFSSAVLTPDAAEARKRGFSIGSSPSRAATPPRGPVAQQGSGRTVVAPVISSRSGTTAAAAATGAAAAAAGATLGLAPTLATFRELGEPAKRGCAPDRTIGKGVGFCAIN